MTKSTSSSADRTWSRASNTNDSTSFFTASWLRRSSSYFSKEASTSRASANAASLMRRIGRPLSVRLTVKANLWVRCVGAFFFLLFFEEVFFLLLVLSALVLSASLDSASASPSAVAPASSAVDASVSSPASFATSSELSLSLFSSEAASSASPATSSEAVASAASSGEGVNFSTKIASACSKFTVSFWSSLIVRLTLGSPNCPNCSMASVTPEIS
mmetsp:Transcript_21097/g.41386  ORF Transcript_21097/g.41386 Transcript_21097/m.41386 type:complete len:216 (+) Transcript_21097:907-1554(+)